jgi:hypothetical protein
MSDEGDFLSIQCKRSLRGPKSMRKVDGPILIFILFFVLALTPRVNSSETSLQLSENMIPFVVCRIYTGVISKGTLLDTRCFGRIIYIYIYRPYDFGDRTESSGTSACISLGVNISPSTETLNFHCERK